MSLSPPPIKDILENKGFKGIFSHIWIRWFNDVHRILGNNANTTITVVSAIQAGGAGGVGFQYKTKLLTVVDGSIKTVGDESSWNDI